MLIFILLCYIWVLDEEDGWVVSALDSPGVQVVHFHGCNGTASVSDPDAFCQVPPSPFCLASPHLLSPSVLFSYFHFQITVSSWTCQPVPRLLQPCLGFSQMTFGGYESKSIWNSLRDLGFRACFSLTKSRPALERWAKLKVMSRRMLNVALEGKEKEVV